MVPKQFIHALAAGILISWAVLLIPQSGGTADFPTKPIQLYIPYVPGGVTDILGRVAVEKGNDFLGQPMVVLNKPGAGGALGIDFVAKSKPDGYTLGVGSLATLGLLKAINPKLSYDPAKDITPVCNLIVNFNVIEVRADSPLNTFEKLIDYAKKNPGKLNYGTSGVGTTQHFGAELFQRAAGIEMLHVPFKGGSASMASLLGGHIDLVFHNMTEGVEQIRAGKVIPLFITHDSRYSEFPQIPTIVEKGYPQAVMAPWLGICGPAGLPDAVVDKLAKYFQRIMSIPDVQKRMKDLSLIQAYIPPAEYKKLVLSDLAKYVEIAKKANITAE